MDININVRAVNGTKQTNTSTTKQVANKENNSPTAKTSNPKKTAWQNWGSSISNPANKSMSGSGLGLLKKATPLLISAIALRQVSKSLNTGNRIIGTITGNRFAETRRADFIGAVTDPIGLISRIASTTFQKNYEVLRDNERIDYKRELAGMSLPYRNGDNGITL
jgi:hypothetical protein